MESWNEDHESLSARVEGLKMSLQQWNMRVFGNIFNRKLSFMARLAGIQRVLQEKTLERLAELEVTLRRELNEILE